MLIYHDTAAGNWNMREGNLIKLHYLLDSDKSSSNQSYIESYWIDLPSLYVRFITLLANITFSFNGNDLPCLLCRLFSFSSSGGGFQTRSAL